MKIKLTRRGEVCAWTKVEVNVSSMWGLLSVFHHHPPAPLTPSLFFFFALPAVLLLFLWPHLLLILQHSCPKRILTCGFDKITHSHTLFSVPFFLFSLFHYLILFSVSQSSAQTDALTTDSHKCTCTITTHMLLSFIGFPLSFAFSSDVPHDHVVCLCCSLGLFMSFLQQLTSPSQCSLFADFKHNSLMTFLKTCSVIKLINFLYVGNNGELLNARLSGIQSHYIYCTVCISYGVISVESQSTGGSAIRCHYVWLLCSIKKFYIITHFPSYFPHTTFYSD